VFCKEGATVALWDVIDLGQATADRIAATGGSIFFQKVNVTDQNEVDVAVAKIIADHGNADQMIKPDGSPHTAHTTALVPAVLVNHPDSPEMHPGILADVAPTLLKCMKTDQPEEMSGTPLF
jgi:bisphosphoglycerate-independent phosphoglycerate mutase (AlkP superfamily)